MPDPAGRNPADPSAAAPGPAVECRTAARDIAPLALGVAVYGLAFGLLATQAALTVPEVGVMGAVVFAGSSQIVAVERLAAGGSAAVALVAGLALNLRLLLITASLRRELAGRPWWQVVLGAHMATDENWALMHATRAAGRPAGYWYLVGGGATLMAVWLASTMAGAAFAVALPEPRALGLDFAFAAAFIAILRGLWRGRRDLAPWGAAVAVTAALVLLTPLDPAWALVAGGATGAATAAVRPARPPRSHPPHRPGRQQRPERQEGRDA